MARALTLVRPRRRRSSRGAVSRAVTFGPALAIPAWGWGQLGKIGHGAGLAVMMVLGLAIIPAVIVLVIFLVPRGGPALMPRKWRKRYRDRLIARGIPRQRQRSSRISKFQRWVTYAADRHTCAHCRKKLPEQMLNCDHYCPWSQGGLTVLWNLVTLCRDCNSTKSNYWPGVRYRPVEGSDNLALAIAILASERRRRRNPLTAIPRLTRAAWALGA
jgi:hypothetical protein